MRINGPANFKHEYLFQKRSFEFPAKNLDLFCILGTKFKKFKLVQIWKFEKTYVLVNSRTYLLYILVRIFKTHLKMFVDPTILLPEKPAENNNQEFFHTNRVYFPN